MADNLERRVGNLETKAAVHDEKFDAFIREMQDFKNEIRQQNEMRAKEISELRRRQDEQQARHDQNMEQLRQDVKDISKEVRNLFLAFVGIIVAIMIGMFWNNSIEREQQSKAATQTQVSQTMEPMNKGDDYDGRQH